MLPYLEETDVAVQDAIVAGPRRDLAAHFTQDVHVVVVHAKDMQPSMELLSREAPAPTACICRYNALAK
ncbi:hypothetical protein LB553_27740 [Mesorhizobium sp. CA8]|nr:hypothetical protein [Mesorhizobium sp. CA8]